MSNDPIYELKIEDLDRLEAAVGHLQDELEQAEQSLPYVTVRRPEAVEISNFAAQMVRQLKQLLNGPIDQPARMVM